MTAGGRSAVLGFDYGNKRIGVAAGQTVTATASPLATVRVTERGPDWAAIGALIEEWRPAALVVGLPRNMDGSEHAMTAAARGFARGLARRFGLPVHQVDERLSSVEAAQTLARRAPYTQAAKEALDREAARVILETWLAQGQANEKEQP